MFTLRKHILQKNNIRFHYSNNNFKYNHNLLIDNCKYNEKFQTNIEDQKNIIQTINKVELIKTINKNNDTNIDTDRNNYINNKLIIEMQKLNKTLEKMEERLKELEKSSGCYCYCFR